VNVELSNEVLAKAKSWELRFYRKQRRKASKKLTLIEPGCLRWIGFSENASPARTDDETIAEGANIRRQSRIYFDNALSSLRQGYGGPRDNASHQLELPAVFLFL